MAKDRQDLLDINSATFAAEGHVPEGAWADVLHRHLAEDFRLRRAIGELETRERMIARLMRSDTVERELVDDPQVAILGDTALVCSRARIPSGTFHNAKLFERAGDTWRCTYWRVTRE